MGVSGRFVDGTGGRILIVSHDPVGALRGAVVVLPALADEMNKSRRLVWSLGQRLELSRWWLASASSSWASRVIPH